jgi:hypothetical protein
MIDLTMKRAINSKFNAALVLAATAFVHPAFGAAGFTTGDTYISAAPADASRNFGADPTILVGNGRTGLIRFDLSSLPAGIRPSDISKATLVFYVNGVTTPGTVGIAPVTNDWSESTASGNVQPSMAAVQYAVAVSNGASFYSADITPLVMGWITGQNFGVALSSTDAVIAIRRRASAPLFTSTSCWRRRPKRRVAMRMRAITPTRATRATKAIKGTRAIREPRETRETRATRG